MDATRGPALAERLLGRVPGRLPARLLPGDALWELSSDRAAAADGRLSKMSNCECGAALVNGRLDRCTESAARALPCKQGLCFSAFWKAWHSMQSYTGTC